MYRVVAQLLFLCKRSRPDLQPAVPFLCTRVQAPDVDDMKKLLRVLKWLERTKKVKLTLEVDGDGDVILARFWPDASFAVHPDYKSHTGITATLGKGAVQTISSKQKLNTASSTEAELVAANEAVGPAQWMRQFLLEQGYTCNTTIYQDNTSAILLRRMEQLVANLVCSSYKGTTTVPPLCGTHP